jgi:hypothetical protein
VFVKIRLKCFTACRIAYANGYSYGYVKGITAYEELKKHGYKDEKCKFIILAGLRRRLFVCRGVAAGF